ncbi:helitron helicase-like domain-containing protein [Streptomonospora nanhaiensis]|uniref:helitron helicase-like domain-containing protein n=1 Tax=Streptomonospora nanhaiensis TaxID=1323731 RepID=UPI001C38F1C7|nr:helitron helicase-like domain-containing protein [Streptomonospora nanhaiensis]MBV2363478.1 helitron helicase-like domain-containing protein [Streptomonospora nanhaiensis]
MPTPTGKSTRAERLAQPLAREVAETIAAEKGVCIRPVALRRTDITTGRTEIIDVPCNSTLESRCPACARRKRSIRRTQCEEGWHLTEDPTIAPDPASEVQRAWVERRAMVTAERDRLVAAGRATPNEVAALDAAIADLDAEITASGLRGSVTRNTSASGRSRRVRSTRRRQDAPELPKRQKAPTTVGRAFEDPETGRVFRPSLFITLTCDTYGRVRSDGTPVDPSTYDYRRAARDALHFSKLIDRFVQNLRRVAGFDVQYFATVEPQRRLAPHLHMATRGTIPRAELRQIAAATYHQVWWPPADTVAYDGANLPVWDEDATTYVDPRTGEVLPTWDEALDALDADPHAQPLHVVRFGPQVEAKGVLAGSPDADRCVRYLAKYLTKDIAECHAVETDAQERHIERLVETLRFEPCSPRCANWLRYGVQPDNPKPGMVPGFCRSKAHRREHLGYAGRRVLVSRKWSGKTMADHKADRLTWVLNALGVRPGEEGQDHAAQPPALAPVASGNHAWELARPTDPDVPPREHRLLRAVGEALKRRAQLDAARHGSLSATERAA